MNRSLNKKNETYRLFRVLLRTVGLLVLIIGAFQVFRRFVQYSMAEMSVLCALALSLDLLCIVLGVFFFGGIAVMKGQSGWFLLLFFLNQMLLMADLMAWLYQGDPSKIQQTEAALNILAFFDLLSVSVFVNLVKQITDGAYSVGEMVDSRTGFDRAEIITACVCPFAALVLLLLNFSYGLIFTVGWEGSVYYGSCRTLFYVLIGIPKLFSMVRICRADISFDKKTPLLLFILLPALACIPNGYWDAAEVDYAVDFIVLLMIFGAFFSELGIRNGKLRKLLDTYVSEGVVQNLLEDMDSQAGKKYTVTVLLTDLRGFTSASSRLSTEETVSILNHWLSEMMEVVREQNGTITEFLGDGFLAVFGAPAEMPDHAERAVTAALRMQEKAGQVVRWNRVHGYPPVRMGIGLSSGEILFGSFGTTRTARLMAIGAPVSRAFEAESRTLGGQIFITPETKGLLGISVEIGRVENVAGMLLYPVTGIDAENGVHLQRREEPLRRLVKPVRVRMRRLQDKASPGEEFGGTLTAVSAGKAAILTEQPLGPYEHFRFRMEEGMEETVYARTGGRNTCSEDAVIADFTADSRALEEFIRENVSDRA